MPLLWKIEEEECISTPHRILSTIIAATMAALAEIFVNAPPPPHANPAPEAAPAPALAPPPGTTPPPGAAPAPNASPAPAPAPAPDSDAGEASTSAPIPYHCHSGCNH